MTSLYMILLNVVLVQLILYIYVTCDCGSNQGSTFRMVKYRARYQRGFCSLFLPTGLNLSNCGLHCHSLNATCLFYTDAGACGDGSCAICLTQDGVNGWQLKSNQTLTADEIIYEKTVDFDHCADSPCVNGSCLDLIRDYTCNCQHQYTGPRCETKIQPQYICGVIKHNVQSVSAGSLGVWSTGMSLFQIRNQSNLERVDLEMVSVGSYLCGITRGSTRIECKINGFWYILSGGLTHLSVSNKGHIWGFMNERVYKRRNAGSSYGDQWESSESLINVNDISVGEAGVWATLSDNSIYYKTGTYGDPDTHGSSWQLIGGSATSISSGDGYVWITTPQNEVFKRAVSASTPDGTVWEQITGISFVTVSSENDTFIWGVDTQNQLYSCDVSGVADCKLVKTYVDYVSAGSSGVWAMTQYQHTTQIHDDNSTTVENFHVAAVTVGSAVCGIVLNGHIYCKNGASWTRIGGALEQISISNNGYYWGRNSAYTVYRGSGAGLSSLLSGPWINMGNHSPKLAHISSGKAGVWALSVENTIYYRVGTYGDNGAGGSGWQLVANNFTSIYVESGFDFVWISTIDHELYRKPVTSTDPTGGSWEFLWEMPFTRITSNDNTLVYGISGMGDLYKCTENDAYVPV